MSEKLINLESLDFMFENEKVKVIANRNHPEIKLVGITVGPFEEAKEYEVMYLSLIHISEPTRPY